MIIWGSLCYDLVLAFCIVSTFCKEIFSLRDCKIFFICVPILLSDEYFSKNVISENFFYLVVQGVHNVPSPIFVTASLNFVAPYKGT